MAKRRVLTLVYGKYICRFVVQIRLGNGKVSKARPQRSVHKLLVVDIVVVVVGCRRRWLSSSLLG